jgi:hypothetical protein
MSQYSIDSEWTNAFDLPVGDTFQEFRIDDIFVDSGDAVEWRFLFEGEAGTVFYLDDIYFGLNPGAPGS